MRYIIIWRRSPSARSIDVQLAEGDNEGAIAVFDGTPTDGTPLLETEDAIISYVNSQETEARAVEATLAHRVLGWSIPSD